MAKTLAANAPCLKRQHSRIARLRTRKHSSSMAKIATTVTNSRVYGRMVGNPEVEK